MEAGCIGDNQKAVASGIISIVEGGTLEEGEGLLKQHQVKISNIGGGAGV